MAAWLVMAAGFRTRKLSLHLKAARVVCPFQELKLTLSSHYVLISLMNASSTPQIAARLSGAFSAIFSAGLLAGILDITAAFITWAPQGVPPVRILQGIASGLLGPQAFREGMAAALLGGALHGPSSQSSLT
jgi:hypothetical protein